MFTYTSIFIITQFTQFTHLLTIFPLKRIQPKFSVHKITESLARSRWAVGWFNTFNNSVLSRWVTDWLFLHLHFCVHYRYCPGGLWIGMSLSIISFAVLLHLSLLVYQYIPNSNMTANILLRALIISHSKSY